MLALHPASDKNPAGKVELGFTVADVKNFYREMSAKGVVFTVLPRSRISAACWRSLSIPRRTLQRGRGSGVVEPAIAEGN